MWIVPLTYFHVIVHIQTKVSFKFERTKESLTGPTYSFLDFNKQFVSWTEPVSTKSNKNKFSDASTYVQCCVVLLKLDLIQNLLNEFERNSLLWLILCHERIIWWDIAKKIVWFCYFVCCPYFIFNEEFVSWNDVQIFNSCYKKLKLSPNKQK